MHLPKHHLAFALLMLAAIVWGVSTPIAKLVLVQIPPFSLLFLRFLLATILLIFISYKYKLHTPIYRRDIPILILIGFFAISLNVGLGFVGLNYATAIDSITFTTMAPVAIALAGVVFLKEKMSLLNWLGQLMAFIGVLIVVWSPTGPSTNRMLGDVLLILSGVAWVISIVLSKEIFKKYHSFTVTAFAFLVGLVSFAPISVWEYYQNPNWISQVSTIIWLGVIFLAVFTSIVAWLAFEWGLEHSTATLAGVVTYFELLVGAIVSVILLSEIISAGFVTGAALILLGIVFATRPAHHYHKATRR